MKFLTIKRHNISIFSLAILLLVSSCYNPSSIESMQDLKLIEGNWKSYEGISFNENWIRLNENELKGEGFSMNNQDTSFYEQLSIKIINDSIYYSVFLESGRSVDFKLTKAKKNKWTFVNPENDFPSIINYEVKNDTLLHISITNIRGNKEQSFRLKKFN